MPDSAQPEFIVPNVSLSDLAPGLDRIPGAAIGIVRDGRLSGFISHGFSDLATGGRPSVRSIARVASVTKTFTATAIMQLRDASLLALDDPLLLHIPEFTVAQAVGAPLEGVTIRRMLTHHSGLSTEHPDLDWDVPDFPTLEHLMDSLEKIKVVIPQDSQWKYSNLAYSLLGEVVSRLSGKPYKEYVLDEIISPLGLENTAFDLSPVQQELKMTGYSPPLLGGDDPRIAPVSHLNGFSAAGQLHSNVEDLATWIGFHLGDGPESVLSQESRSEMQRPVYVADDWSSGQGLGWRAVRRGDHVFWNHGGALHGFATGVVFSRPTRTGAIVLMNTWPTTQAQDLALSIAVTLAENTPAQALAGRSTGKDEPVVSEFAGRYRAEPGLSVEVTGSVTGIEFAEPVAGEPTLHAPASLEPSGLGDTFTVRSGRGAGEDASFLRDDSGAVIGFRFGGFLYRKLD